MLKKIKKVVTNREEYYPNIEIFSYHVLKFFHKNFIKIGLARSDKNNRDMFNWTLYHIHYKGELKRNRKTEVPFLSKGDYEFVNNKLVKKNDAIKPLHTSSRLLYETILQLSPQSVFEMGCGSGVHMHNVQTLLPNQRICGIDLSNEQLAELKKIYPKLSPHAKQADATETWVNLPFKKCDVAFTQAVIMHIHTGDAHLTALENLFKMSDKYVVLYESAKNHPFLDDIKKLHAEKRIVWDTIFFHYRINEENGFPTSIICSKTKLPYPELTDYGIFFK